MQVAGDAQFDVAGGYLVPPQWFAMWARRHQYEYGSTTEDLGRITITERAVDARHDPVWLVGSSNSQSGAEMTEWVDPTAMYSLTAGPRLWDRVGMTASDMDLACMYDVLHVHRHGHRGADSVRRERWASTSSRAERPTAGTSS
ncbi:hypothetical protein GCM10023197_22910 [Gordonia humi]|uniref:Uncharacterized protein n=1 Tax=Gordonia humi TaxID=686429 RepID=A0A840EXY1_9ACTN|nr:hypothetical protein [Gordonia humi]